MTEFRGKILHDGLHAVFTVDELFFVRFSKRLSGFFRLFSSLFHVLCRVSEVAHQHEGARFLLNDILNGRKRRRNPRIVLHNAVFHRHIEIDAHNYALSRQIDIFYRLNHTKLLTMVDSLRTVEVLKR